MKLDPAGREYATWSVNAPAGTALEASFDNGTTWHAMERPTEGTARILVAGPQASDNPAGTAVLTRSGHTVIIRLTDTPETVIRDAGTIYVTR